MSIFCPTIRAGQIARKLVRVNLSDLAAKGAQPRYLILTCCFSADATDDWLAEFAAGLAADCREFSVAVIGGDTVATPGPLTLSLTAIGAVAAGTALLRSGACSGDDIWVSGTIGDAALGLAVVQGRLAVEPADGRVLVERYRLPQPRLVLGRGLQGLARASMDISDGLVADLGHICRASGVSADLLADRVPLSPAAASVVAAQGRKGMEIVLTGGDDYELLFTAPPTQAEAIRAAGLKAGVAVQAVGRVIEERAGEGGRVQVRLADGSILVPPSAGYRHFSGAK